MTPTMTREAALELLCKYNKEPFHLLHALTVEGVMRWFAQDQGYGADPRRLQPWLRPLQ